MTKMTLGKEWSFLSSTIRSYSSMAASRMEKSSSGVQLVELTISAGRSSGGYT
jgi:hypothetical protein